MKIVFLLCSFFLLTCGLLNASDFSATEKKSKPVIAADITPNSFTGSDIVRIQSAINAAKGKQIKSLSQNKTQTEPIIGRSTALSSSLPI
jgi:hypothetical protein